MSDTALVPLYVSRRPLLLTAANDASVALWDVTDMHSTPHTVSHSAEEVQCVLCNVCCVCCVICAVCAMCAVCAVFAVCTILY